MEYLVKQNKNMRHFELMNIPLEYDTVEKKLAWLDELSLKVQKNDNMNQEFSFILHRTKEYWKNKL